MKARKPARMLGLATAAVMLAGQLTAMPALGAEVSPTAKAADCTYSIVPENKTLTQGDGFEFEVGDFGVGATDVVTEVLVDYVFDTSQGKPTMPAFGYTAPGCGEYDWYSDGQYFDAKDVPESVTIKFPVSKEYALPSKFQLQLWGENGLESCTVNAIGLNIKGGGSIGVATRLGDANNDRLVSVADVIMLVKFLIGETDTVTAPANVDMDKNGQLDARDLTLLKRGLLDGTLGGGGEAGDETAMEFVSNLRLGWNLGNTLDSTSNYASGAYGFETAWGCPYTTKAMIDAVKAAGFNAVRVPVSWGQKCSGSDYKISDEWMKRVQEVVDYVIDNDMYCILNIHHDNTPISNNAYFYPDNAHLENSLKFVSSIWKQVSAQFAGYDNHLIFETLNEPRLVNTSYEWSVGSDATSQEAYSCINQLNAAALKEIRAGGGNNAKRFVMMPGYAAKCEGQVLNALEFPNDDHLILSIHAYTPYSFALDKNGTASWDENSGGRDIVQIFETCKSKFLDKGIPVIVGEMCAVNKNNEETRAKWAEFYTKTASSYGVPVFWWDNCQFTSTGENCGLLDREAGTIKYPAIMSALLKGTESRAQ